MPQFQIVTQSIPPPIGFVKAKKFASENKDFDSRGVEVGYNYDGRMYRLIEKYESDFSYPKRIIRIVIGSIIVIFSLFIALSSQWVRNLLIKKKVTIRYGKLIEAKPKEITSPQKRESVIQPIREEDFKNADPDLIKRWEEATLLGNVIAKTNLALCYGCGHIVEKSDQKMFELLTEAAEEKYIPAMNNLALAYQNGRGTDVQLEKAFALYKLASDLDDPQAHLELAGCFLRGLGCEKDSETALELLQKISSLPNYQENLHEIAELSRDETYYFRLLKIAAQENNPPAIYDLAVCYLDGNGVKEGEESRNEALKLLNSIAFEGFKEKIFDLSDDYWKKDAKLSFDLLKIAASANFSNATFELAVCYLDGLGVTRNDEEAFKLLKSIASDPEFKEKIFKLSNEYEKLDAKLSFDLLQLASSVNHLEATFELAVSYLNGYGVDKDEATGLSILNKLLSKDKSFYFYNKTKKLAIEYPNNLELRVNIQGLAEKHNPIKLNKKY